ncbi:MAG: GNAT family N-acetyltransferase [Bacteroidales bacterium]|nr:GNAT family N-acetyltransferase [Bacteroidales bacterium]
MFNYNCYTKNLILELCNYDNINNIAQDALEFYSDNEVLCYSGIDVVNSYNELLEQFQKYLNKNNFYIWALYYRNDKKYIGDISLTVDFKHKFAFNGCILNKKYWGKGLMQEALKELLTHAFFSEKLHRVEVQIHIDNIRSIKFYEKFGFVYEGKLRENFLINNKFYDSYVYSMLCYEFYKKYIT